MTDSPETAEAQQSLVIERRYKARVEDLWALWTTRDGFESWWGPDGFRVEVHALEARAGGALSYDMIADAPEAIAAMKQMGQPLSHGTRGWFEELVPNQWLVLMHSVDFVPGMDPYDSRIDVSFAQIGEESLMVVTLHPHRDPMWTQMSAQGFTSQLGKLDRCYGWSPD